MTLMHARPRCWSRHDRFTGCVLFPWHGSRDRPESRLLTQQGGEPRLIEKQLLARRLPQRVDLLGFAPAAKSLVRHPEFHEPFDVLGFVITAAPFPVPHRSPRDTKDIGQPH